MAMPLNLCAVCTPTGGLAPAETLPFGDDDAANAAPVESPSATALASRMVSNLFVEFMAISPACSVRIDRGTKRLIPRDRGSFPPTMSGDWHQARRPHLRASAAPHSGRQPCAR